MISKTLFVHVQAVLRGKTNTRSQKHDFLFRRLLRCKPCGYSLIAERQKGHVYYRCHSPECPTTCVREEEVLATVYKVFKKLVLSHDERNFLLSRLAQLTGVWSCEETRARENLERELAAVKSRLSRLTDAFLDGTIEKDLYEEKKMELLCSRKKIEEMVTSKVKKARETGPESLRALIEQADSIYLQFLLASPEEKRELLQLATSNRTVEGKSVVVELHLPFSWIADRPQSAYCALSHNTPRTEVGMGLEAKCGEELWNNILNKIIEFLAGQG